MILDSTYVFDLMAENREAFEKGTELVEQGEIQWLPTPVVAEAYYGAMTVQSSTTPEEVRNALLGYPRIELNDEIARRAGKLLAQADDTAGGSGRAGVGWNDAHIAATADVLDDAVLAENVDDFETLGVDAETY